MSASVTEPALSLDEKRELLETIEALRYSRIRLYQPYPKQRAFHALGATKAEALLMAGNQEGKTFSGSRETTYHLTGNYPEWWEGRRFEHPIRGWCAGVSNEQVRDVVQKELLGEAPNWGTGAIPKDCIVGEPVMSRGIPGQVDYVRVKHVSGGISWLSFKSYEQGRRKFQGDQIDFIWLDEEPPPDIFAECQARTTATNGYIIITFTPLLGITEVVDRFYPEPDSETRGYVRMELADALHIKPWQYASITAKYPAHMREARTKGIPMLGAGLIFPIPDEEIVTAPFQIPEHWAWLGGMDIGRGDHPSAFVKCALDRDYDTIYVVQEYKTTDTNIGLHVDALREWGTWLPWAWPHDANTQADRTSNLSVARMYHQKGLAMLPTHSHYPDGGYSPEVCVMDAYNRMESGRLKVFTSCPQILSEKRTYHRDEKTGQIVKRKDDLLSALFKVLMMLRAARVGPGGRPGSIPRQVGMDYDPYRPQGVQ